MEVLDDEKQRRRRGAGHEPLPDAVDHCLALGHVDVVRRRSPFRCRLERRQFGRQPGKGVTGIADSAAHLDVADLGRFTDDRLGEGTVRLVDVLVARPEQHPAVVGVHGDRQFRHETALSHPGLTRDEDRQRVPGAGELPLLVERETLGGTTHEALGVGEELERRRQGRHRVRGGRRRCPTTSQLASISGAQLAEQ